MKKLVCESLLEWREQHPYIIDQEEDDENVCSDCQGVGCEECMGTGTEEELEEDADDYLERVNNPQPRMRDDYGKSDGGGAERWAAKHGRKEGSYKAG